MQLKGYCNPEHYSSTFTALL
uniref:Uncharacterized protein n=1 Tax=Anguilla anguilla TaxID=7936 RepID=A0A0E9Q1V6_ANGAN